MKANQLSLVVFDMAGTTLDEDNLVYRTLRDALRSAGVYVDLEEVLRLAAGMEKRAGLRAILQHRHYDPAKLDTTVAEAHSWFRKTLEQRYATAPLGPQPGAGAVIADLRRRGVQVVLNTGYDRATAEQLLDRLGWRVGRDIDGLVTASDVERGRPAPDMIELAMRHCGVTAARKVMKVGDSTVDIEEGRNAGCGWVVGVTTGAHTRKQLAEAGPDLIVDRLSDIEGAMAGLAVE